MLFVLVVITIFQYSLKICNIRARARAKATNRSVIRRFSLEHIRKILCTCNQFNAQIISSHQPLGARFRRYVAILRLVNSKTIRNGNTMCAYMFKQVPIESHLIIRRLIERSFLLNFKYIQYILYYIYNRYVNSRGSLVESLSRDACRSLRTCRLERPLLAGGSEV